MSPSTMRSKMSPFQGPVPLEQYPPEARTPPVAQLKDPGIWLLGSFQRMVLPPLHGFPLSAVVP